MLPLRLWMLWLMPSGRTRPARSRRQATLVQQAASGPVQVCGLTTTGKMDFDVLTHLWRGEESEQSGPSDDVRRVRLQAVRPCVSRVRGGLAWPWCLCVSTRRTAVKPVPQHPHYYYFATNCSVHLAFLFFAWGSSNCVMAQERQRNTGGTGGCTHEKVERAILRFMAPVSTGDGAHRRNSPRKKKPAEQRYLPYTNALGRPGPWYGGASVPVMLQGPF